jgi:hypothetical protein
VRIAAAFRVGRLVVGAFDEPGDANRVSGDALGIDELIVETRRGFASVGMVRVRSLRIGPRSARANGSPLLTTLSWLGPNGPG